MSSAAPALLDIIRIAGVLARAAERGRFRTRSTWVAAPLLERGNLRAVADALESSPELANRTIRWHLNQDNESDSLHYLSDCVGHGWLTDQHAAQIALSLLAHGASVDGSGQSPDEKSR